MHKTSTGIGGIRGQLFFNQVHQKVLDHKVARLGLRSGIDWHENRTGSFAMDNAAVKSDQVNGSRLGRIRVTDGPDEIGGKALLAKRDACFSAPSRAIFGVTWG